MIQFHTMMDRIMKLSLLLLFTITIVVCVESQIEPYKSAVSNSTVTADNEKIFVIRLFPTGFCNYDFEVYKNTLDPYMSWEPDGLQIIFYPTSIPSFGNSTAIADYDYNTSASLIASFDKAGPSEYYLKFFDPITNTFVQTCNLPVGSNIYITIRKFD